MKIVILALLVAVATAADLKLKFAEGKGNYEEKIKVDQKTVEYDVPKHEGVEQSEYLNDYDANLIVMKIDRLKKCYAYDMPSDEYKPNQVAAGLSKFGGKFPEDKYMVINNNILPLHYLNGSSLTPKIQAFCGNYPVIKVAVFKDRKGLEEAALAEAKATVSGGRQKRGTVTDFYLCDRNTMKFVGECGRSGDKLKIKCKFVVAQTCVYKVGCDFSNTGWQCPVPDHVFHYLHCCDYAC